jgi:Uma2 family endonuclease
MSSVPPHDLVVEVDLTGSSLDKLPIYASLGVAEVWRYAGGRPDILGLRGKVYERMAQSRFLPPLTSEDLIRSVEEGLRRERRSGCARYAVGKVPGVPVRCRLRYPEPF